MQCLFELRREIDAVAVAIAVAIAVAVAVQKRRALVVER